MPDRSMLATQNSKWLNAHIPNPFPHALNTTHAGITREHSQRQLRRPPIKVCGGSCVRGPVPPGWHWGVRACAYVHTCVWPAEGVGAVWLVRAGTGRHARFCVVPASVLADTTLPLIAVPGVQAGRVSLRTGEGGSSRACPYTHARTPCTAPRRAAKLTPRAMFGGSATKGSIYDIEVGGTAAAFLGIPGHGALVASPSVGGTGGCHFRRGRASNITPGRRSRTSTPSP